MYYLKLYITGKTSTTKLYIDKLYQLLETQFKGVYELEVINIFEEPEKAQRDNVFATPTMIRQLPEPMRRIIGDLSDQEKILAGLDLRIAAD